MAEFGAVAIGTYFTIFFSVWFGFWLAIRMGYEPASAAGGAGTVGAAYVATKVTQPIRIAATLVLTPLVAGFLHRVGVFGGGSTEAEPPFAPLRGADPRGDEMVE